MSHGIRFQVFATAVLGSCILLAGCRVTAELSQPFAVAPRQAEPQPTPAAEPSQPNTSPVAAATTGRTTDPTQRADSSGAIPGSLNLFGDRPEVESVPFESRLITNLRQHSFTTEGLDFDPDIYDPEDILVFASTRNSQHPDIFLKTVDGFTLTQLTGDPADDIQPRFSPSGDRVVFASNRGGTWDIWLINRDGTSLTQLTRDGPDEIAPCWSPDGKRIAYTVWGDRSHQWEIWTLAVDQPGVRQFLAYGMFPTWSPEGSRIAFQRARERGGRLFSIWMIDLVDGEARHPTEVAHSDTSACVAPRWSPDGKMIVYCSVREGERAEALDRSTPPGADLWVVELKTGLRMKLTDSADSDFNPVWAGDGRIFFVSARSGSENIWSLSMSLEGYAARPADRARVTRGGLSASSVLAKD